MKNSRYNHFVNWNGFYFGVNTVSGEKIFLPEKDYKEYESLKNEKKEIENPEISKLLTERGFIVADDTDEFEVIKTRHLHAIYTNNGIYELTLMPTLDCNLRCWYCYEKHIPGKMSEETMERVKLFAERICRSGVRSLQLGWFGGEPLIYFDEVMYPLAKSIKEIAERNGLKFGHSITTNGVLMDKERIRKMQEVGLNNFQITIDGNREHHNKSRVGKDRRGTYDTIIANVNNINEIIEDSFITLRINYTNETFNGLKELVDDLNKSERIQYFFQRVWQNKEDQEAIEEDLSQIQTYICENGCQYAKRYFPYGRCHVCYADVYNQAVVNYNGELYKCTARDFAGKEGCVGYLDHQGYPVYNSLFYKRFATPLFDYGQCRECVLLPVCYGACSQKLIEHPDVQLHCHKEEDLKALDEELYEGMKEYIEKKLNRKL